MCNIGSFSFSISSSLLPTFLLLLPPFLLPSSNALWMPTLCHTLCWALEIHSEQGLASALTSQLRCVEESGLKTHCIDCWNRGCWGTPGRNLWGDEGGMEGIAVNLTLQLNLERQRGVSLMVEVKKDIKGRGNSMCQRDRRKIRKEGRVQES